MESSLSGESLGCTKLCEKGIESILCGGSGTERALSLCLGSLRGYFDDVSAPKGHYIWCWGLL